MINSKQLVGHSQTLPDIGLTKKSREKNHFVLPVIKKLTRKNKMV
ncbi:hypothetical protein SCAZ3_09775 [Streptococcus canis FSL Z3-227]|uniref:Uncharacterized protein n=1 Tax=Streptococcus canis FSL Z3-227 TaxID=482234 RepID=A0AAV3FV86_STRCB|nr:hypothetical protein SCAZ3_09775 [Streptococcus canis FSL Z3-227]